MATVAIEKAPTREIKYAWQRRYPDAKLMRIVVEENENIPPTGLFVAVNGDPYVIVPGEEVEVPDFLLAHLDNASMGVPVVDPNSRQVVGYRTRTRYPYRIVYREP